MEDIKATLNTLLAKDFIRPKYSYSSRLVDEFNPKGEVIYECKLNIYGFDYVGKGEGKSKKGAQTEAAKQFVEWLIENGHFSREEFPQLSAAANDENGDGNGEQQNVDGKQNVKEKEADKNENSGQEQQQKSPEKPLEDIKCTLHAILGKNKKPLPVYTYYKMNDGRQYYECDCTIEGYDFVADSGRAQQKKQAQTQAAEVMAKWLVENGHFDLVNFPALVEAEKKRQKEAEEKAEFEAEIGLEKIHFK